jgi:hypothetical protein
MGITGITEGRLLIGPRWCSLRKLLIGRAAGQGWGREKGESRRAAAAAAAAVLVVVVVGGLPVWVWVE